MDFDEVKFTAAVGCGQLSQGTIPNEDVTFNTKETTKVVPLDAGALTSNTDITCPIQTLTVYKAGECGVE